MEQAFVISAVGTVIGLLLLLLFALVVKYDAKQRGMRSNWWACLTFFGGLPGLLIYLILRKPRVVS